MASGAGSMLRDGADGYAPFPDYDARDSLPDQGLERDSSTAC
jgi:hypothetical protein